MKRLLICMINWYQRHLSTWLASRQIHCKYYPTCSEYAKQAIDKYGAFKGMLLGGYRILRCNPLSKGRI